jgi:hypothetical protein
MILWLSGFGCSLCSVKGAVTAHCAIDKVSPAPSTTSATGTSQESCQTEELECCKKRAGRPAEQINSQSTDLRESEAKNQTTPLHISQQEVVISCSLLPKHLSGLNVIPLSSDHLDVEAEPINSTFATNAESSKLAFTYPVLPHNRGGTYLRCCVFLI